MKEFNSLREEGKTLIEVCQYFNITANQLSYLRNKEAKGSKRNHVSNVRPVQSDWKELVVAITNAIRTEAKVLSEKADVLESLLN